MHKQTVTAALAMATLFTFSGAALAGEMKPATTMQDAKPMAAQEAMKEETMKDGMMKDTTMKEGAMESQMTKEGMPMKEGMSGDTMAKPMTGETMDKKM